MVSLLQEKKPAKSMLETYEISFLVMAILCNFAQGFKRLIDLGLYNIYKERLGLEPSEIEFMLGLISMPWVAKILFAIVVDNVTFFGSRRKSYLMLSCIINLAALYSLIAWSANEGKYVVTACVMLNQICMTVCDAIGDALIVQAARLDPEHGADNLNSVTQGAAAAGGLIGCGVAGLLEYYSVETADPNIFFGLYSFLITLLTVSVAAMSHNMEPEIVVQ